MRSTLASVKASRQSPGSPSAKGSSASATMALGFAAETVEQILNYGYRTSSNSAYVSPTRGQQGNALQTALAMAHALSGRPGITIIKSRGVRHRIAFDIDPISREPRLDHEQRPDPRAVTGTTIVLLWPERLDQDAVVKLHNIAIDFTWVNPHLTLSFAAPDG